MAQQKVSIPIPRRYSADTKRRIAKAVIDFIRDRSFRGIDRFNNEFPEYSEKYAKEKGVPKSEVDLVLSGKMLQHIKVLAINDNSIEIGYGPFSKFNDRAEGNILGSYGGDPNPAKARDFLGIDAGDLNDILKKFPLSEENQSFLTRIYRGLNDKQRQDLDQEVLRELGITKY